VAAADQHAGLQAVKCAVFAKKAAPQRQSLDWSVAKLNALLINHKECLGAKGTLIVTLIQGVYVSVTFSNALELIHSPN
nr:hypothetical protein [Thiopseudomonas sp.]